MTIETQEPAKKVQTDRKRCFECNKKMGLFGFECKCTYMFCTAHRLPEEHKCGFNHHEHEKEKLKQTLLTSNTKIHLAYTECLPCEKCGEIVVRGDLKSHVNAHADLILDNLYLGDKSCSKNRKDLIERKRVTHIVNAAAELKNYFASDGIKYLNLPLNDNKVEELISEVLRAAHFIHEAIDQGGIVFVHCAKGKSRSVSAIIMYLMVYHQLDYSESLNLIRASRPRAKPNSNYEVQLKLYYQNILKPNGH
jgi:dual specificity phosphatase 12